MELIIHTYGEGIKVSNYKVGGQNVTVAAPIPVITCKGAHPHAEGASHAYPGLSNAREFKTAVDNACAQVNGGSGPIQQLQMTTGHEGEGRAVAPGDMYAGQRVLRVANQDVPGSAKKMEDELWFVTLAISGLSMCIAAPCLCPVMAPCGSAGRVRDRSYRMQT